MWMLRWESVLELRLVLQILPVLLIPLQTIFNNAAEEVLSWIEGVLLHCDSSSRPLSSPEKPIVAYSSWPNSWSPTYDWRPHLGYCVDIACQGMQAPASQAICFQTSKQERGSPTWLQTPWGSHTSFSPACHGASGAA